MAAPAYKNFSAAVLSDAGTISSPSDTAIGDLMVFFVWAQSTNVGLQSNTVQSGFTRVRDHGHDDGTTDGRLTVATKVATAAGVQSYTPFTISGNVTGQTCVAMITVTGANTIDPATWISNSVTDTTNAVPNPPSLAALYNDVLVLAISAWQVTTAGSTSATVMANYTMPINGPAGSHVTHLAVAYRSMTGLSNTTEDPAAYGDNVAPNGSASMTIAIPMVTTFQAADATDDFNRADNANLGANWTQLDRNMTLTSNKAQAGQVQWCSSYWNALTFNDDQFSEVIIGIPTGGSGVGPMVRMKADFSYYYLYADGNFVYVQKVVAGAASVTLNTITQILLAGALLRIEVQGSTIRAYIAGTLRWQGTDTSVTTGAAGILTYAAGAVGNATIDSWSGGNFVMPLGQPTMRRWGGIPTMLAGNLIGRTW